MIAAIFIGSVFTLLIFAPRFGKMLERLEREEGETFTDNI